MGARVPCSYGRMGAGRARLESEEVGAGLSTLGHSTVRLTLDTYIM
jgi:hypothetical protein